MGDAGAMFLGLLLATTTITIGGRTADQFSGQTYFFFAPLFIPLVILGVPIVDTAFSFVRRVVQAASRSRQADKEHLHHRLMRLGHGPRRTVVILWLWTALLSAARAAPDVHRTEGNALVPARRRRAGAAPLRSSSIPGRAASAPAESTPAEARAPSRRGRRARAPARGREVVDLESRRRGRAAERIDRRRPRADRARIGLRFDRSGASPGSLRIHSQAAEPRSRRAGGPVGEDRGWNCRSKSGTAPSGGFDDGLSQALSLVVGPVLFGLLGCLLDQPLGTAPLFLRRLRPVRRPRRRASPLYYRYQAAIARQDEGKPWTPTHAVAAPATRPSPTRARSPATSSRHALIVAAGRDPRLRAAPRRRRRASAPRSASCSWRSTSSSPPGSSPGPRQRSPGAAAGRRCSAGSSSASACCSASSLALEPARRSSTSPCSCSRSRSPTSRCSIWETRYVSLTLAAPGLKPGVGEREPKDKE